MTAYERGVEAYNRGESHEDNPYAIGTKEREEWAKGMSKHGDLGL